MFKFNDHIAEGQLDLGPYFIKAYKTRDTVKLFPTIDPKLQEELRKADVSAGNVCTRTNVPCFQAAPAGSGSGSGRGWKRKLEVRALCSVAHVVFKS